MRQEDSRIDSEGNHMSGMKDSLEEDNVHLKTPLKVLSNRRGQKKSYPAKCHAMRIRNSKNRAVRSDQATDNVQGDSSMWRCKVKGSHGFVMAAKIICIKNHIERKSPSRPRTMRSG
ncbi:hypothetical protein QYF36_008832 [Acer negundo]|nr:hypothetical protein QYF36_008832 [Acer negundo]